WRGAHPGQLESMLVIGMEVKECQGSLSAGLESLVVGHDPDLPLVDQSCKRMGRACDPWVGGLVGGMIIGQLLTESSATDPNDQDSEDAAS
ncbi:MAG: hypothetical protein ACK57P_18215, partial [Planctomycetota bacterium]